jgi:hypothetical protein
MISDRNEVVFIQLFVFKLMYKESFYRKGARERSCEMAILEGGSMTV